jgi:hypothetical protein
MGLHSVSERANVLEEGNMKLFSWLGGAALALAIATGPALAHHGWSGQSDKPFELTGTLKTAVSLAGPHATMQIADKNGQVWDLTLASPAATERAGLKEGVIPLGAMVTIRGKRSSDLKRFEVKTERVTYAGKNFDVYPDRV